MLNNSSDNIVILIGGVVGGVVGVVILLLIITAILCIVCMRRCRRKEASIENDEIEGYNLIDQNDDHIDPATTVPSQDVPRKTSEDGCNFVEPNEQSYGEGSRRNTINPLTYEVSTGENRVTASSTTLDIRAHQPLSDDATKEYDPCANVHANDDQPAYGVNRFGLDDLPPSSPLHANSDEPNGIYCTVINQQINNV